MHKSISKEEYYRKYIMTDKNNNGICYNENCNNKTRFLNFKGYERFCSLKCACTSKEIINKRKNTFIDKYGVDCALKVREFKDKAKDTCIDRFGSEHFFSSEEGKNRIKEGMLEKYGVDNPTKSNEIRKKVIKTSLEKYGSDHYMKTDEYKNKIRVKNFNFLLRSDRFRGLVEFNFNTNEYDGVDKEYSFICIKCGNKFLDHMNNGRIPRCKKCFPININKSKYEDELFEFLVQNNIRNIIRRDRSLIGLELDLYIPDKKLAIEFDGLHWHSESSGGKISSYHLNKTVLCKLKGINLIHIFEDEWIQRKNIVKSMLRSKIGLIYSKIPARKCIVGIPTNYQCKSFLEDNHIQGIINGKSIGLYYKNELVSLLVYGRPRFNKNYDLEILRFCNKIDTVVVGGLSKLLSQIADKSIITYVDRRYGTGVGYSKSGFKRVGETDPSYYYFKEKKDRINRITFQKHKLKNILESFDPNLTEWQNMQLNGYDRIWDCGNYVYIKENL